jgi:hypothetical protein
MNRNLFLLIVISFFIVTQPCMAMENKNHSLEIIKKFTPSELFNTINYLSKNTFFTENISGYKILNAENNKLTTITNKLYPIIAINQKRNLITFANSNTITFCRLTGETTQCNTNELHLESFNSNLYKEKLYQNSTIYLKSLNFNPRNNTFILCLEGSIFGYNIISINKIANNRIQSPIFTTKISSVTKLVVNPVEETLCTIYDQNIHLYSLNNLEKLKTIPLSTSFSFCKISHKNILALMHNWHEKISLINLNTKDTIIKNLESSTNKSFDYMAFYPTTSILVTISSSRKSCDNSATLCFWNTITLQPIFESTLPKYSSLCDFSPNGKEMLIQSPNPNPNTYTIYSTPYVIYREHITNTFSHILFLLKNIRTQDNPKTFLINDIARLITYIYANKLSFY